MKFKDYIEDMGVRAVAELFEVSESSVYNFARFRQIPEPKLAFKIVKATKGLVDWCDIYEPYFEEHLKGDPQLEFGME